MLIYLEGSNYVPCDENLTNQLEDGLKKYIHIQLQSADSSNPGSGWKWPLLGPYLSQMVSYEPSKKVCWIQSDYITDKLARAIALSAGTKLIRGWNEVQEQSKKIIKKSEETATLAENLKMTNELSKEQSTEVPPPVSSSQESSLNPTKMRKIEHLVFVVHGIGQKLSASMNTEMGFVRDVQNLKNSLTESSAQLLASSKTKKQEREGK